ncbi:NAD(P)-dependent oxidoreductase [Pseudomonas sp. GV071]|uniref:NAD-dependent epimerase/dehydratase family protein n=1 Tax=Pseudomonas sp. GV071 TaxID=2135754 RepID=UPI000D397ECE|nr:NAD-dependent epimerase/dehydratase family protein [Pseudomonas sp. GV071]PTQ68453.1 nucleoside-diphosphate-sugar epimerase [Pseudomonas sp. GV071]
MIVCVSGASGFIGRHLCAALLGHGYVVRGITRDMQKKPIQGVEYFYGDISTGEGDFSGFFAGVDLFFNCAGEIVDPARMLSLHVDGTVNLLGFLQQEMVLRSKPVRWIQLSSVGAYGLSNHPASSERTVDVHTAERPEDVYEITKTVADHLVLNAANKVELLSCVVLRPTIVVGAEMSNQSFFQLSLAVKKKMFFYVADRHAIANYVHVDDVIAALVVCGFAQRQESGVYIVANDCPLRDVINAIADFYQVSRPKVVVPQSVTRFLAALFSKVPRFPLTQSRIDALLKRTSYSPALLALHYGVRSQCSLPESIPAILQGRR